MALAGAVGSLAEDAVRDGDVDEDGGGRVAGTGDPVVGCLETAPDGGPVGSGAGAGDAETAERCGLAGILFGGGIGENTPLPPLLESIDWFEMDWFSAGDDVLRGGGRFGGGPRGVPPLPLALLFG